MFVFAIYDINIYLRIKIENIIKLKHTYVFFNVFLNACKVSPNKDY